MQGPKRENLSAGLAVAILALDASLLGPLNSPAFKNSLQAISPNRLEEAYSDLAVLSEQLLDLVVERARA